MSTTTKRIRAISTPEDCERYGQMLGKKFRRKDDPTDGATYHVVNGFPEAVFDSPDNDMNSNEKVIARFCIEREDRQPEPPQAQASDFLGRMTVARNPVTSFFIDAADFEKEYVEDHTP